jgi:hypothetical protein
MQLMFRFVIYLETHLYPSAFPRSPSSPLPRSSYSDVPGETKEQRHEHLLHELWRQNCSLVEGKLAQSANPPVLWNVINRFVRNDKGIEGITLFLAHANGFYKEICDFYFVLRKF